MADTASIINGENQIILIFGDLHYSVTYKQISNCKVLTGLIDDIGLVSTIPITIDIPLTKEDIDNFFSLSTIFINGADFVRTQKPYSSMNVDELKKCILLANFLDCSELLDVLCECFAKDYIKYL